MLQKTTTDWMINQGFDPDNLEARGNYQDTAVIAASRRGEHAIVEDLVLAGANLNALNMDGTNALWAACVADNYPIADLLLKNGIDLDNQNENGATVLMYAASTKKRAWVNYFLAAGANTDLQSLDGFSALDLASEVSILKALKAAR